MYKYLFSAAFKIKLTSGSGNAGTCEKLHDRSRVCVCVCGCVCVCVQAPLDPAARGGRTTHPSPPSCKPLIPSSELSSYS